MTRRAATSNEKPSVTGRACEFAVGRRGDHHPCGEPAAQWVDPRDFDYEHVHSEPRAVCADHVQKEKDRIYQANYYQENADTRLDNARIKWASDADYRKREINRKRDTRAVARAPGAEQRFLDRVAAKQALNEAHRAPRWVTHPTTGEQVEGYTTGALGQAIGRDTSTVRMWLSEGVLPGCSVVEDGKNWFSRGFVTAVFEACRKVYFYDGRGEHNTLKRLILEALNEAKEGWVQPLKNLERAAAVPRKRRRRTARRTG